VPPWSVVRCKIKICTNILHTLHAAAVYFRKVCFLINIFCKICTTFFFILRVPTALHCRLQCMKSDKLHCESKSKPPTNEFVITSPNIDRFSKFFHTYTVQRICNEVIINPSPSNGFLRRLPATGGRGELNGPRHISSSRAHSDKIPTATPIFSSSL